MLNFKQNLDRSNVQVKGKTKHLTGVVKNQGIICRPSTLALKMFLIGTKNGRWQELDPRTRDERKHVPIFRNAPFAHVFFDWIHDGHKNI